MPRSQRQKLKLLYLQKILRARTDDAHRMSADALCEALAGYGIHAERKSIYEDMDALAEFGEDILRYRGRNAGFAIGAREFELAELRLLADVISSSRFLTARKSRELIAKVEGMASRYEAAALGRQVHVAGRVKTANESIFLNVDALHAAMAAGEQVAFRYFKWSLSETGGFVKQFRREGADYIVSPWALIWDNLNYYLAAYDSRSQSIRHYRVDKMERIRRVDAPREGQEAWEAEDPEEGQRAVFGMFHGETQTVVLRARNEFADVLRDRFGAELSPYRVDADWFEVSVRVAVSPQFFGWLAGLEGGVRPVSPDAVVTQYRESLKNLLAEF